MLLLRKCRLNVILACFCFSMVGCATINKPPQLLDDDSDAVANNVDACPGTPQEDIVDQQGCSLFRGAIEGVVFAAGTHQLEGGSRDALAGLVQDLKANPTVVLALAGHTDNRGRAAENLELSKQRVMSVVKYLVSNGIEPERLRPIGYGESRPSFSNVTEEGRMKNRRIEMSVFTP